MISAIIFDLDGTLVQSEKLKAQSYAIAVQRMRGLDEPEPRAIEASGRSWLRPGSRDPPHHREPRP